MNKYSIILYLLLFSVFTATAQPNSDQFRDNVWILGYDFNSSTPEIPGVYLNFSNDALEITEVEDKALEMGFTNGSICDENGDLLVYSNGCAIADYNESIITGGEIINDGVYHNIYCGAFDYYAVAQGITNFFQPESNDTILLVHQKIDTHSFGPAVSDILLTKVVVDSEQNLSAISVDESLLSDTITASHLSVCRHGNGKDWWLFCSELFSTNQYSLLFTSAGVEGPFEQSIGDTTRLGGNGSGGSVFSPDGTKYIKYDIKSDIQIFDFDRCTGNLSNYIQIPIQDLSDTVFAAGIAISPNSRFLYASSTNFIYQFDLESSDIEASKIIVAEYDGFLDEYGQLTYFYMPELAPDGKIYITCPGTKPILHVIHNPNEQGTACNVEQHGIVLNNIISNGLPHFPNFRLGPIVEIQPNFNTTISNDTVQFVNNTVGGTDFHWDFGDNTTSVAVSPEHIYEEPGQYIVTLTAMESCVEEVFTDTLNVIFTDVNETFSTQQTAVYPNPNHGTFIIDFLDRYSKNSTWSLTDTFGKVLQSGQFTQSKEEISTKNISAGLYLLKIRDENGIIAIHKVLIL
jgi:hypothetical protein